MRYRIERIELGAALRWAAVLGLVGGLVPSLALAGVVVALARRLMTTFGELASFSLTIPAQTIGPLTLQVPPIGVDLVERLGWGPAVARISALALHPLPLFLVVAFGLALVSALLSLSMAGVIVLAYNQLARRLGGIEVRLAAWEEEGRHR